MQTIFLASAAKCGSTHIKNCFARLGWRPAPCHICLAEGHYNDEHNIDPKLASVLFPMKCFVFHEHVRAIAHNTVVLKELDVKPVVLYRNIFDSMVSFIDSTNRDWARYTPEQFKGSTYTSQHLPNWGSLTENEKLWWTVYNMVPWWFSYYISWRESGLEALFVDYTMHYADQVFGIKRILSFYGIEHPPDDVIQKVVDVKGGKFNVGKGGRGDSLPDDVKNCVVDQSRAWGGFWAGELNRRLIDRGV